MGNDDLSRYLHYIAHLDMPLEAKIELLRVVQVMMQSFVDRAFGDDPVQLALKSGDETQLPRETRARGVVSSKDHNNSGETALTDAFMKRAGRARRKENT